MSNHSVVFYVSPTGENPVSVFVDSLTPQQQAKVLRLLQTITIYGLEAVSPHCKKLSGTPLWELRILEKDNIRVLYVLFDQQTVLSLHAFMKKKQKAPSGEISLAMNRLEEWRSRT